MFERTYYFYSDASIFDFGFISNIVLFAISSLIV